MNIEFPYWQGIQWIVGGIILVLTYVIAVGLGWPVTRFFLKYAARAQKPAPSPDLAADTTELADPWQEKTAAPEKSDADAALDQEEIETTLRAGGIIGILERAAVVLCILAGQPIAIAYVVAIKALGRYPELVNSPKESERFIVGTLASILWASFIAVIGSFALQLV